ncbi:MAG TPA: hypothetical protein VL651_00640, partial [Bacteroidia bacterium]|nr:hypothetical protein [Bacteroidia bacterium]
MKNRNLVTICRDAIKCRDALQCVSTLVAILFFIPAIHGQNLDKIGQKNMVTVNGSANYNTIFYHAFGMDDRRDPFTWYFNGNLNISILDVSLPFTYSYSDQHSTYSQPFNMQSCSPKYKWAQGHFGTTAMNFSSYTLAGHLFTGGGMELRPGKFYIGAMYGRLLKAVAYDATQNSFSNMAFRRMGEAMKLGYEDGNNAIGVSWFRAKDDEKSLLFIPDEADLYAQENTAMSVNGKTKLLGHFIAEGEFAISGLTRNINALDESMSFNGLEKWMMRTKTSTQFFYAYKYDVGYSSKNISVTLNHEHVDPDYQTFGAYYFNNDLDNWTIAPSFRLFAGKVSIAFNGGFQKNNLDRSKQNTTNRLVGSTSVSVAPNKNWMLNASYSDFTSFTNRRPQVDPFWFYLPSDTLLFYQVSRQGNGMLSHSFGTKNTKSTITLSSSYQVAKQTQSGNSAPPTTVFNSNLSYNLQLVPSKITCALIGNYNRATVDTLVTQYAGPGIQLSRTMMKSVMKISFGTTYNRSYKMDVLTSHIL